MTAGPACSSRQELGRVLFHELGPRPGNCLEQNVVLRGSLFCYYRVLALRSAACLWRRRISNTRVAWIKSSRTASLHSLANVLGGNWMMRLEHVFQHSP